MSEQTHAPAGWHVDPEDPSLYRYWDGARWTEHRAPRSRPARAGNSYAGLAAIAALALLAGAFLAAVVPVSGCGSIANDGSSYGACAGQMHDRRMLAGGAAGLGVVVGLGALAMAARRD